MIFEPTYINGLSVITLNPFQDIRGELLKPFNTEMYQYGISNNVNLNIKEVWFTKSKKDVIRAMHLQVGAFACEKIVTIIQGKVHDVVLDIRDNSPTYGQYFDIILDEKSPKALYIPIGCAHGYKILNNNSIVMYMATQLHVAKDDVGIRYNSFGFDWGIENPILSEKDKNLPLFGEYKFNY
ncbi:MAG: dTDP-4-dehydrorhamnose 3,5-epimerase family protein [Bacteroidetes bacterium]|nr:dTDP-4-dehydrorhamnose 3,5-epimerase family protein [Bacteroidota bacterium]MCL1968101.1 dTDP-4-dehydrorhamnose 3,5-epimerase family protein [Bacteroidota bacterium]